MFQITFFVGLLQLCKILLFFQKMKGLLEHAKSKCLTIWDMCCHNPSPQHWNLLIWSLNIMYLDITSYNCSQIHNIKYIPNIFKVYDINKLCRNSWYWSDEYAASQRTSVKEPRVPIFACPIEVYYSPKHHAAVLHTSNTMLRVNLPKVTTVVAKHMWFNMLWKSFIYMLM